MSEMRWHPLLEQWVITATHRQARPVNPPKEYCPLCPTIPGAFPTEVPADRYEIVVFENRFPSLHINPPAPDVVGNALHPVKEARGVCEVVLYSDDHDSGLSRMPLSHIHHLVQVWADRYDALSRREEVQYVFIFENRGEAVGVTLHHPHGQIYAYPFVPPIPEKQMMAAANHFDRTGRCLLCDIVRDELSSDDGDRIVAQNDHFAAYVPFFARFPFEVHITPKHHVATIVDMNGDQTLALAEMVQAVTQTYDHLFGFPLPYMMAMHQGPAKNPDARWSHFHIEFYTLNRSADKLKYLAGSESGAGAFITDMAPEQQAQMLREAQTRIGSEST